jgi:hypothetical protein
MRPIRTLRALAISTVLIGIFPPNAFAQTRDADAPQQPAASQQTPDQQPASQQQNPSPTPDDTPTPKPDGAPLPSKDPDAPGQPTKPSLLTPLAHQVEKETYFPITPRQRLRWVITETTDPSHSIGGIFTAAYGTAVDHPAEYGPHWSGFAERYGIRTVGVATSNTMEAGMGMIWGEDPRYFSARGRPFGQRVRSVVRQTFTARRRDGEFEPAYARFIGITGGNFLSNTWRADSEADTQHALIRSGEGFLGRMAANTFEEFWPSVKDKVFHQSN